MWPLTDRGCTRSRTRSHTKSMRHEMNASELYKSGRLTDAIAAQIQQVRSAPLDQGMRLFLFELLTFAGDIDRSRRQIETLSYDQIEQVSAHATYCQVVNSEQSRRWLFDELDP